MPHVKYGKFEVEYRQKMQDMKSCVEVTSCPCWQLDWPLLPDQKTQICRWPLLHKHIREWEAERTFRGVVVCSLSADPMKPSLQSATTQTEQMRLVADTEIVKSVYKMMKDVTNVPIQWVGSCVQPRRQANVGKYQNGIELGETSGADQGNEQCRRYAARGDQVHNCCRIH